MRADQLMEAGDMEGRAVWLRIARVVEELLSEERPEGTKVPMSRQISAVGGNQTKQKSRLQLTERTQALDTLQTLRRKTLARLDKEIGSSRRRIEEMDREREELEALLDSMTQALAGLELKREVENFTAARGNMPWPARGRLRNHFGAKRGLGGLRWQGLMIGADEGQDVHAIHHGRVVYADWLRGSGLLMIIDHGDGYMSLYAHNQLLLRETGEWVTTGDTLARVGATGGQQQSGLYFEIRHRGAPLDPVSWCSSRT